MKAESALKVGILSSSNYITVLVNTILFPIFPLIAVALELDLRDLAFMVGIVSFPAAIINLFGGMLADHFGRKLVIVVSLFLYGLGGLVAGLSVLFMQNPFPIIMVGRFVQGVGSATPMFLTVALVGDIFQSIERSKAVGFLETANGLGKISSPIIGAAIGLISWKAVFFIYPIVAFPVAILTWIFINEPQKKVAVSLKEEFKAFHVFKNTSRILTLLAAFLAIFMLIGSMFWLSDFLEAKLQINQMLRGLIIALPAIAMMLTTLFAGIISKKFHPRLIISAGLFLMSVGILSIPFTVNTLIFWPAIVIIGVGAGTTLPAVDTVSTSVESKEIRGRVTTVYGAVRSLGGALSPITISLLLDIGFTITFLTIAAGGVAAGIAVFLLLKEKDILPKELLPQN